MSSSGSTMWKILLVFFYCHQIVFCKFILHPRSEASTQQLILPPSPNTALISPQSEVINSGSIGDSPAPRPGKSNLLINQRPRFKIPRGKLSYYRNPDWEILYFLKFGKFPQYSQGSPFLSQSEYLDKMKKIRMLLLKNAISQSNKNGDDEDVDKEFDEVDFEKFVETIPLPLPLPLPGGDDPLPLDTNFLKLVPSLVNEELDDAQEAPMNNLNKLLFQVANEMYSDNHRHPFPKFITKKSESGGAGQGHGQREKKVGGGGSGPGNHKNEKDFLVDTDPSWLNGPGGGGGGSGSSNPGRTRITKNIFGGNENFYGGIGAGGAGLISEIDGDGGAIGAEMTIDRKVNRKFQTQGWKK